MDRSWIAIAARILLPLLPATILVLTGLATFWGGLLFFLVSEIVRWIWIATHPVGRSYRPLVEFAGILGAPLFTVSILLVVSALLMRVEVQEELIHSFGLYLCYIPYAFLTLFLFPALER